MKKMKKFLALLIALAMVLSMGMTVFATGETDGESEGGATPATGTITITLPTETAAPTNPVTYKIYKVFDATVDANDNTKVSYTLSGSDTLSDEMKAAGFSVDNSGNVSGPTALNQDAIDAIAAYVTESDVVGTVISKVGDLTVTSEVLDYGYYYITTSTGSVVTIDSNNNTPTVLDKNIIPDVVKSAGSQYDEKSLKAIAAVGTDQPFTAQITKTKGAKNLIFTDTMTDMTYNGNVVVKVGSATVQPSTTINDPDVENETFKITGSAGDSEFKVEFDNDYIASLTDGTVITLNYSGKITSAALSVSPATNKATLSSGDGNITESETVKTYNAIITVKKEDGDGYPLPGAGFVLRNSEGKYYKLNTAATASEEEPGEGVEGGATASETPSITWYELPEGTTLKEAIEAGSITENTSDAEGVVPAFVGLGADTYTLIESTVPGGYNNAGTKTIEIKNNDYNKSNLEQNATVTNNKGNELPSTGGIGTTIFYIIGGILVVGAGVVLITRRRMDVQ